MTDRDLAAEHQALEPFRHDDRVVDPAWTPVLPTDEERWRAGLDAEVRPLVERCRRLRDRDLLD